LPVWQSAQPFDWNSWAPVSDGGKAKAVTSSRFSGKALQVHQNVLELLRGDGGPAQLSVGVGLAHARAMIPHLLDEHAGIGQRLPFGHRRSAGRVRCGHTMAFGTMESRECLLAARGVARFLEVAGGGEIGEKIGRRLGGQGFLHNPDLAHGGPHIRSVVPHEACHGRGREVAVDTLTEIGRK
jgi:hypothetical protein